MTSTSFAFALYTPIYRIQCYFLIPLPLPIQNIVFPDSFILLIIAINKVFDATFPLLSSAIFFLISFSTSLQISKSNASHITLNSVELATSGKYSCEVTLDAPSFMTGLVSGDLQVVGKSLFIHLNSTHSFSCTIYTHFLSLPTCRKKPPTNTLQSC